jgi:hypothetical protein
MTKNFFLIIIFFVFCYSLKAQPTLDTIKYSLKKKPHVFAKLDNRNSFIDNNLVNIFGVKAGLSYNKKLGFGIGYYQLYNAPKNFDEQILYINSLGKAYIITKGLEMYYFSANVEYSFYQTKHWELSMPLQIGIGKTFYRYTAESITYKTNENIDFIYEPTISVDYKIIKWVGVCADFGYRFMITQSTKLNKQFNSPVVALGVSVYYSEILKFLFPKCKMINAR